jgi:hypothetical protein
MRIKILHIIVLVAAGMLCNSVAKAQFIRFNIQIPPGFDITDRTDAPKILEPAESLTKRYGLEKQGIRWLELRAVENIQISVQLTWKSSFGQGTSARSFFLNDGTTNFSNAIELKPGLNSVFIHNGGKVISAMPDKPKHLSAWLGLPSTRSGTLLILYP